MSLLISGATVIDGVAETPLQDASIWIECGRIKAIGRREQVLVPPAVPVIDAKGKYIIPGLMNANVHLYLAVNLESIARYTGRFEELIAEAAQVALKNGLTTVFDTWGPRRFLMSVREKINAGEVVGSRLFCAGNIIGLDGPFSPDFFSRAPEVATSIMVKRVNSIWVENVGRHLMWLTPEQITHEVGLYLDKGIDFVKYASNEHYPGAFLAFSPAQQAAIVERAHRAGTTAQAHTMSVEGLRIAIQAGCDLIQHANKTGPIVIPQATLDLLAKKQTGAVVFPHTEGGLEWLLENLPEGQKATWKASDVNARNFIRCGAKLLLANDGAIVPPEWSSDPQWGKSWVTAPLEHNLSKLASGHFIWFKAMEEKGCPPMQMLRAATRNIAEAYGKEKDLGTLEAGKLADLLILERNPLDAAENYRSIHSVIKEGVVIDRDALPLNPIFTAPMESPSEEEAAYIPFLSGGKFPSCC